MPSPACATCRHGTREYWQIVQPPSNPRDTVVYCHLHAAVELMFVDESCERYEWGEQVKQLPLPKASAPDA